MKDEKRIEEIAQEIMTLEETNQYTQIENIISSLSLNELFQIDEYIIKNFEKRKNLDYNIHIKKK